MDQPQWEGAVNARIVLGSIYRMGRREWLTSAGWQQAHADGVRTVIDLRNPNEQRRRPTDPQVDEAATAGITIVNAPTEEPGHPEFEQLAVPYMNHPRMYPGNIKFFPDRIAEVFHQIAAARGKVVIHCSAGRDRTGLIVSMLLKLVDRQDLLESQYEASLRGINDWHKVSPVKHPHESYIEEPNLIAPLNERLEALVQFVDSLGVESFLLEHGLSPAEVEAIRTKMA
ncbi:tyrosine-protein phosphatase [Paeniglutamicibacter sp.]|uniref:tyrosine-protein phosphatase n=1 Tax=Paeniglutamicibacter sp. TaxID=1934391 RepID=UPI003989134C